MSICRKCGKKWQGYAECHCSACHEHFRSVGGFDKHRIWLKRSYVKSKNPNYPDTLIEIRPKRCLNKAEMEKRGMVFLQDRQIWVSSRMSECRTGLDHPRHLIKQRSVKG